MKAPLHILHLEDDLRDATWVEALLEIENIGCKIIAVRGRQEFQAALAEPELDLILSDFSMPGYDGFSALEAAQKERPNVPFIFLSGTIGEEKAVRALRAGATDYVLKDRMARLPAAIRRAMSDVEAKVQHLRDEARLRNKAALLDLSQDAICVNNMDQTIAFWNASAERMYGWSTKEAMGRNANDLLFQEDLAAPIVALKSLIRTGRWQGEFRQVTKEERKIIVESRWTLMRDEQGKPESILIVNTDITQRKQIEAQFLRTQRTETIGALAGGIAHDLNNSLTPVLMVLSLIRKEMVTEENKKLLDMAQMSAKHSVDMVKQILSFSRGVGGEQAEVKVGHLINDITKFAEDTFPRAIKVESCVLPALYPVTGNATQLYQVLLNLCVNARDAMPNGGKLCLEAKNVTLEEEDLAGRAHTAGPYVLVTVTDTGQGMTPKVLAKIFEPFFTTKEIDKGTGLGLSTVMGIVKTHSGFLEVSSEVGKGSTFKVFLPVAKETV